MARAQFQVLIIPYRIASGGQPEYAIAKRSDMDAWQFFAGGEEENEAPIQSS
jgi:dATP pyrophosphohydrolase